MDENSIKTEKPEYETLDDAFKRSSGLIIVLSIMLVLLCVISVGLQYFNSSKSKIYLGYWAPDMDIKPVVSQDTQEETKYYGSVLTETPPVNDTFFASTIFIGDSLTQGLSAFDVFDNFIQVAKLGINPQNALTEKFYKIDDTEVTMADAVEYYKPQTVYIMLGANGINTNTPEWLIENYEILVDEIKARVPGCSIVVQSITPATRKKAESNPEHYSPENIQRYNEMLKELALRKGLYFLDVYSSIADTEGYMPDDMTSGDGVHMKREGYLLWYNYLLTHTIQGNTAYLIDSDGHIAQNEHYDSGETEQAAAADGTVSADLPPTDEAE